MMRASCGHAAPELRSAILADVAREDGENIEELTNWESGVWAVCGPDDYTRRALVQRWR